MRRWITILCVALIAGTSSIFAQTPVPPGLVTAMRNAPLPVARQYLQEARSLAAERCYSDAVTPLLVTAEALAYFEAQQIGRIYSLGATAGATRQQILNYTSAIETNNYFAVSMIDGWLDQIEQWSARPH